MKTVLAGKKKQERRY